MSNISQLQDHGDKEYEAAATPFDVEEPDEWIALLEKSGNIHGNVLDAGCGPGRTSCYLADRGYSVLGVDISVNAIERAKRKAAAKGNKPQFLQANMCELSGYDHHFDTVVDIGCFHSLSENDRGPYAAALHRTCRAGVVVYLRAFSTNNSNRGNHPSGKDLPALSDEQIRTVFSSNGWVVKDLVQREIELFISNEEKPKTYCWFVQMQYVPSPMQDQPSSAHEGFTKIYAETNPPWDIGKPQPPFVAVADQVVSPVLDAGCGTGGTSLFFAARGLRVTGIDFVEEAIRRARAKADERGLAVDFLIKDAMTLGDWDERFSSVIDSGLFHIYAGDERQRYVRGLAHVLKPGGRLFLFSFNDDPSWPGGGVSRNELYDAFAGDWNVESLELVGGEVNPAFAAEFPETFANMKMWFAIIRRKE